MCFSTIFSTPPPRFWSCAAPGMIILRRLSRHYPHRPIASSTRRTCLITRRLRFFRTQPQSEGGLRGSRGNPQRDIEIIYRFDIADSKAAKPRRVDAPDSENSPVGDEVTSLHLNPQSEPFPVAAEVTRLQWTVGSALPALAIFHPLSSTFFGGGFGAPPARPVAATFRLRPLPPACRAVASACPARASERRREHRRVPPAVSDSGLWTVQQAASAWDWVAQSGTLLYRRLAAPRQAVTNLLTSNKNKLKQSKTN